jgi:RNA polymerase sigma factor (sigma-70 family)
MPHRSTWRLRELVGASRSSSPAYSRTSRCTIRRDRESARSPALRRPGTISGLGANHCLMGIDFGSDEASLAASLTEPARFAAVFERRVDGIYRYLSFRVGLTIAEDLTSETFARAFAGRRGYRPERGSVSAWLYGIANNLLRDHHKDELRRMEMLARSEAELIGYCTDSALQLAERLRLAAALALLDEKWRNVVLLIGIGGLSYEETATALHIPIGTVRSRYSRARTQMAASLAETAESHMATGEAS